MRKKAGPVIAALLLIIVIVLIFVVGRKIEQYIPSEEVEDLNTYYSITSADDVAIVLNPVFVSAAAPVQPRKFFFPCIHDQSFQKVFLLSCSFDCLIALYVLSKQPVII